MHRSGPLLAVLTLMLVGCETSTPLDPQTAPSFSVANPAPAPGRIVVNHDEWTLGNFGFPPNADGDAFALSLASWFTGGGPGQFLVYSRDEFFDPRGHGSLLQQTMTGAGHGWTISTGAPVDVAAWLANYDAVFLAGPFPTTSAAPDNQLLIHYVEAGGQVYLAGGTGEFSDAAAEAAAWNTFLNHFNLNFGPIWDVEGKLAVTSGHPIFAGVDWLLYVNGNPVSEIDPADPRTDVLETSGSHGLIAVYEAFIGVLIDIKPGSDQNCINNDGHGVIPVAILGGPDFDVTSVDAASIELEGLVIAVRGKSDKLLAHIEDVNADGWPDLMLQIEDVDGAFTAGSTTATLTGRLTDGMPIKGVDEICVVPS